MQNIFNHNRLPFTFRLDRSQYWDFYLSQPSYGSEGMGEGLSDRCLISFIDTTDPDCVWFDSLYSKKDYFWDEAINEGLLLENIGYTGVDNGLFHYEKDRTSNEIFLNIYKNSQFKIEKDDIRLLLNKVYGNNQIFNYANDITEEDSMVVAKLNGGFYQGFFRTDNGYKVLPRNIGNGLTFEVVLKKHDFDKDDTFRLNDRYPENKGIFLYIGTRAENKWWEEYNNEYKPNKIENGYVTNGYVNEDYMDNTHLNDDYIKPFEDLYVTSEYFADGYLTDKCDENCCCDGNKKKEHHGGYYSTSKLKFTYPEALNVYEDNAVWFDTDGHLWVESELLSTNRNGGHSYPSTSRKKKCNCIEYFADDYIVSDYYDTYCTCDMYAREDYIKPETKIDVNEELIMKDGYSIRQVNIKEYRSDNKFLLFDRTCDGFTTETWEEGSEVIITDVLTPKIKNYFLLFDRTCNGYTTETIDKLIKEESNRYNILDDLYRNAIAFQIDDNGRIGYKYFVKDCDSEEDNYKIETEWSKKGIVKDDIWSTVTVRFEPIGRIYDDCSEKTASSDKMNIRIYVNGKLRFVSKELPTLNLRKLNDAYSKQEAVPFNISLGGGTQGLCDVIYLNYRKLPEYVLPLESEFAGTFIGYIKSLRIYDCGISFNEISQNAVFDGTFGKK